MEPQVESEGSDPEDILSTSLQTIYGYQPITHSSGGSLFTYNGISKVLAPLTITLRTPDTQAANWSLHASSIWVSSLFLADHLEDLHLDQYVNNSPPQRVRVLELGAAAGLPGILIAKIYEQVLVTVSDYPDEKLIQTLSENVARNGVSGSCRVVPYAWGSDASAFSGDKDVGFDVIVAADTLWNPESHSLFVQTLKITLKKSADARIHLVAGLHTGRYTLQSFLDAVGGTGFDTESVLEKEVNGEEERAWSVSRAEHEDERERRRWVVWISLRWKLAPSGNVLEI